MIRDNEIIQRYVESVVDHAYKEHVHELRNEGEDGLGKQITNERMSFGKPKEVFTRADMREHIFDMLEDPRTQYVIHPEHGRMSFFNPDLKNGGFLGFAPNLNKDGHAGTFFKPEMYRHNNKFEYDINHANDNSLGVKVEPKSVTDLGWLDHMERHRAAIMSTPQLLPGEEGHAKRSFTDAETLRSDLAIDTQQADIKTTLDLSKVNAGPWVDAGITTGMAATLMYNGATPAEAAGIMLEEPINAYEQAQVGNYHPTEKLVAEAAAGGMGAYVGGAAFGLGCSVVTGGTGTIPCFIAGFAGSVGGGTLAASKGGDLYDEWREGQKTIPSMNEDGTVYEPDPELLELKDNQLVEDRAARYAALTPDDGITMAKSPYAADDQAVDTIDYAEAHERYAVIGQGPDEGITMTAKDLALENSEDFARVAIPLDNMRKGIDSDPMEMRDMWNTFSDQQVGKQIIDLADKRFPEEMGDLRLEAQERIRQQEFQKQYEREQSMLPNAGIPIEMDPTQRMMRGPDMNMGMGGM